jgi:uncharacterized protein (DUF983 family)
MQNQFEPSKGLSILKCKCPRCQSGDMFVSDALTKKFMEMHHDCPHCKLRFEIEPGFFWGAMYISYAFTTGIMLVMGALVYFVGNNPDTWIYLSLIIGSFLILTPFTYRYARVLMIHLFSPIRFDRGLANIK